MMPTPLGAEIAHDAEKKMLLLLRQRSGGFVHDDDARARAQGAGDFDELLLGHRKLADSVSGSIAAPMRCSNSCAVHGVRPNRGGGRPWQVQGAARCFRRRSVGKKRGLLIDAGYAEFVRPEKDFQCVRR